MENNYLYLPINTATGVTCYIHKLSNNLTLDGNTEGTDLSLRSHWTN